MTADFSETCLVVRLGSMGDVVLTTGVLKSWHARYGTRFIFITKKPFAPVLQNHPAVSEIIPVSKQDLTTPGWFSFCRRLGHRLGHLQLVDLHASLRSRILGLMWPSRTRVYPKMALQRRLYSLSRGRFFRRSLLETDVPGRYFKALCPYRSGSDRLEPCIYLEPAEKARGRRLLAGSAIMVNNSSSPGKPLIALHPYATHPAKAWPTDHWLSLITLLEDHGMEWIVLGRERYRLLPDSSRDLTSRTDIRQTCALLKHCSALVTGDSGPMHLARAVNTPLVAMFGPTTREWGFFPTGEKNIVLQTRLPCRPCSLHGRMSRPCPAECMTSITPREVLSALQNLQL
ncbi:glycosyltransferase family 9 protein [Desulfonatronospira sp.]|uniref:glycosyltransferase family 9 protein n=1 Tax=Desulfonatronospira sp. TaxID=1962951 RepID=UPI0025C62C6C|nr:glycosyltransferase family 9 protein [Desulfonatronospira sp.]